ncbi:hypothetical protein Vafri_11493 [Volvox africanus]|nr:hypothetical protein Vafri_11493 [Volvox africanus]GIL56020.1 hypothetical protein Vafri_11493 [Volvox africanus]GIL56021.1 hypothetical protein Vafri_11493 [Volvox africanus]GIL56026.1 hypothetical protein Vafri_11493 [Volvox africanus]
MRTWAACLLALAVLSAAGSIDTVGGQNTSTTKAPGKPLKYPPAPPSPPNPPYPPGVEPPPWVMGEFKFTDTHSGDMRYTLYDENGTVTPFGHGYQPPEVDNTSIPISPGDVIKLDCTLGRPNYCGACPNGESATCTCPSDDNTQACMTASQVSLVYSAYQLVPFDPYKGTASSINYRLLVMILDYSACGFPPSLDVDTVTTLYMGPNRDGNGGVAEKFKQCSYGKVNMSYVQAAIVKPACSTAVTSGCSWWAISSGADAAAKAQLGLPFFSNFTYYTYVVPPKLQSVCPWAGLALLPGKQTWLQSTGYGVLRWATIMQETIHNFGLWHSWRNGWEYEDYSTAMGRGDSCPNAAEISRLGWATAAAGGGEINTGVLTAPGTYVPWTLPATYITGDNNYLRVVPNWMPTYNNNTLAKHLYIALRVPKAGDAGLTSTYINRVHVHETNASMDNGYPQLFMFGDRKIQLINTILPNTRQVLPGYNLVIVTGALASNDTIQVSLCRYEASDSECSTPSPPSPPPASSPPPSKPSPPPPQSPKPPPPKPSPKRPPPMKPSLKPPAPKSPAPKPPAPKPPAPKPPAPKPPAPKPPPNKVVIGH